MLTIGFEQWKFAVFLLRDTAILPLLLAWCGGPTKARKAVRVSSGTSIVERGLHNLGKWATIVLRAVFSGSHNLHQE